MGTVFFLFTHTAQLPNIQKPRIHSIYILIVREYGYNNLMSWEQMYYNFTPQHKHVIVKIIM